MEVVLRKWNRVINFDYFRNLILYFLWRKSIDPSLLCWLNRQGRTVISNVLTAFISKKSLFSLKPKTIEWGMMCWRR